MTFKTPDQPRLIWNPVEREWGLSVPGRRHLAAQVDLKERPESTDPAACSFCPGGSEELASPDVHLVPSRHPMIDLRHSDESPHWVLPYGFHHAKRLADLPLELTSSFLQRVAEKTRDLFLMPAVRSVYAFESFGGHFGTTVAHPHGQIVGLPFVPRRLTLATGPKCILCGEEEQPALDVHTSPFARLAVPAWSRLPFEMVVAPAAHRGDLSSLTPVESTALAECVHRGLRLCRATHDGRTPPYLLNVMQAPRGDPGHHLRIEIIPLHKDAATLKRPGAMELGLGVYLNPLPAEDAASILRDAAGGGVKGSS